MQLKNWIARIGFALVATQVFAGMPTAEARDVDPFPKEESARIKHARELLGRYYRRSVVRKGESATINSDIVYEWVKKSLARTKHSKMARKISNAIVREANHHGFDPIFVMAVIQSESSFVPTMRGSAGEIGLMQILPDTARYVADKFDIRFKGPKSLTDPLTNIRIGTAYLSYLREKFDNHGRLYLAAYNMGPTNVNRALAKSIWPKDYPQRVMSKYVDFYSELQKAN